MRIAHDLLMDKQKEVRASDKEEPLLYQVGDWVWLKNRKRKKHEKPRLLPKFVGPYLVKEVRRNHTYLIEKGGQSS